jgi:MoaA/NifB/PqqE/SkfB family radical SAM enzyme
VAWLLDAAARYRVKITFQPARLESFGSNLPDPITPAVDEYRSVMRRLVEEKRRGNPWITTSATGLEHLASFPQSRALPCQAGKLYFRIQPNGDVLACTDVERPARVFNIRTHGLAQAIAAAVGPGCGECWGASRVDFNYAAALHWDPVANIVGAL